MEKHNPNHCIANIYKLAERNGVFIKDLEKKIGLSPGYLSRCKTTGMVPKTETLFRIADEFNVSVDLLVHQELSNYTPDEKLLLAILAKGSKPPFRWIKAENPEMFLGGNVRKDPSRDAYRSEPVRGMSIVMVPIVRETSASLPSSEFDTAFALRLVLCADKPYHLCDSDTVEEFLSKEILKFYDMVADSAGSLVPDDDTRALLMQTLQELG